METLGARFLASALAAGVALTASAAEVAGVKLDDRVRVQGPELVLNGYGVRTRYAHQSRVAVVVGQQLKRGDRLGYVGSTGLSTGPHLHYEVIIEGRPTDPLKFVMPNAIAD